MDLKKFAIDTTCDVDFHGASYTINSADKMEVSQLLSKWLSFMSVRWNNESSLINKNSLNSHQIVEAQQIYVFIVKLDLRIVLIDQIVVTFVQ